MTPRTSKEPLSEIRASLASHRYGRVRRERRVAQVEDLLARIEEVLTYCDSCDEHGGMPVTTTLRKMLGDERK